jgi:hypothetical protein
MAIRNERFDQSFQEGGGRIGFGGETISKIERKKGNGSILSCNTS